jgi:positive regulator of sigma E activity
MAKEKRKISKPEEFQIMKVVLDKFLLLGVLIMFLGIYMIVNTSKTLFFSFSVFATGAIIMLLFSWIIVKEYEFLA